MCNETLLFLCVWAPGPLWQLSASHLLPVTPGESNRSQTMESNDRQDLWKLCVWLCMYFGVACTFSLQRSKWAPLYEHVQRGVAVGDRLSLLPGDKLTSPNGHLRRIDSMSMGTIFPCMSLCVCLLYILFVCLLYFLSHCFSPSERSTQPFYKL